MAELDKIVAEARKKAEARGHSYRDLALKMYPWVCGRCTREFSRETLSGLTVHHKDHNHDNNPPDGSNWELLCLYCHDNEHQRYLDARYTTGPGGGESARQEGSSKPFAGLRDMLRRDRS